jgi:hypothetical protein
MIDDQVNAEELAESRKQREAAANATDDGMPVALEEMKSGSLTGPSTDGRSNGAGTPGNCWVLQAALCDPERR